MGLGGALRRFLCPGVCTVRMHGLGVRGCRYPIKNIHVSEFTTIFPREYLREKLENGLKKTEFIYVLIF